MHLWGREVNHASIDLYDRGSEVIFVIEAAEEHMPFVLPLSRRSAEDLIRLLTACLDNYRGEDE